MAVAHYLADGERVIVFTGTVPTRDTIDDVTSFEDVGIKLAEHGWTVDPDDEWTPCGAFEHSVLVHKSA